jgi:hypothetical protein
MIGKLGGFYSRSSPVGFDPKPGSISARIAAVTFLEKAAGARPCVVSPAALLLMRICRRPALRSFENGMVQWLALPTVTEHFPEARPPVGG